MTPAVERFRELLRIPTVSHVDESQVDWARFDEFQAAIERLYPALHERLEREIVDGTPCCTAGRARSTVIRWC